MSVRPVRFNQDGTVEIYHDESDHSGALPLSSIVLSRALDGRVDPGWVLVPCPVCDSSTAHPASGGAAASDVQELFIRVYQVSDDTPTIRTRQAAEVLLRQEAEAQGGRSRIADPQPTPPPRPEVGALGRVSVQRRE